MQVGWYRKSVEWLRQRCCATATAWNGASLALLSVAAALWAMFCVGYFLTQPRWVTASIAIISGLGASAVIAILGVLAAAIIYAMPVLFVCSLVVALLVIYVSFQGLDNQAALTLAAFILPPVILLGSSLAFFMRRHWRVSRWVTRIFAILSLVAGAAGLAAIGAWALSDGQEIDRPVNASDSVTVKPLNLESPNEVGSFNVKSLTYGSGKDLHRPHYAADVTVVTPTVDASSFTSDWTGWAGRFRTYYWGFGPDEFPLNARVWMPEGEGPFPLVLILHGNTMMEVESEDGYGYLAELLASRGYIVASLDENFLNSSWHSLWQGIGRNNARAWILLQHLKLWRGWNKNSKSRFFGLVDMDNIGLIGHSRGGEAVALAAAFNRLPYYPDNCKIRFDFDFGIRAVAAVAPVDGQYQPTGRRTPLHDINYFVIHGSYDSDVRAFQGSSQFDRVTFDNDQDWFKASAYIYGANHGQFNTMWGRYDQWPLETYLLNVQPLLPPQEQRRIAQVYISAFMDTTLKGKKEYRELFRDHRSGSHWLPPTIYLTQYEDASYRFISTYEGGLDVTKGNFEGAKQVGENLTTWREHEVCLRYGCTGSRAVFLGWDVSSGKGQPSYRVQIPSGVTPITENSSLVFVAADADESSIPEVSSDYDGGSAPIDFTIQVTDDAGQKASLPLSHYSALQPSLGARIWKADWLENEEASEIVFQSFVFPMMDFIQVNAAFNPAKLTEIRFVFDRTPSSVIVMDDLGIRPY